jgi:hypothetical protein
MLVRLFGNSRITEFGNSVRDMERN